MLNGVDPLLVIVLKNKGVIDFFGADSLLGSAVSAIGLPIPIYLSERLTGVYVDSETRGIDVTTKIEPVTTKDAITQEVEPPQVSQTSTDSQVSINMVARNDCILLTAILALMDLIVDRLVSGEYAIHYINGPTVIFGALLHRFGTSVSKNDNLVRMELVLSTAAKESPTPKAPVTAISKVAAAVPL
jgi:hypothetical protein